MPRSSRDVRPWPPGPFGATTNGERAKEVCMAEAMERARGDVMSRFFERFDPDFGRFMEGWWPFGAEERIRIEQAVHDDALVVRAELPGIDPDKDVEISVSDGYLHLRAELRSE